LDRSIGEIDLAIAEWTKAKELGDYSEFLEEKLEKGTLIE